LSGKFYFLLAKSNKVFSAKPTTGTINKNQEKYNAVATCPIST
jgi:hypothetical protein